MNYEPITSLRDALLDLLGAEENTDLSEEELTELVLKLLKERNKENE